MKLQGQLAPGGLQSRQCGGEGRVTAGRTGGAGQPAAGKAFGVMWF